MTRRELRRVIRTADDATAWQAREWLERYPSRREEWGAGADEAYAAAVARGRRYAWGRVSWSMSVPYLAGYVLELAGRAVRNRVPAGAPLVIVAAVVGALAGLWLSPGRAYAAPVDVVPAAATADTWPACKYEDGSGQARCVWDGRHMGNGRGPSLKIRHGGTDDARYVRVSHRTAHRLAYGAES